ncbi:MAG: hypothetical protein HRT47_04685 [Candidatus Caenarcaniphilales bacterium]|nr:hypothetical protein [Candidatus Caenarcaniphilales bacterium]
MPEAQLQFVDFLSNIFSNPVICSLLGGFIGYVVKGLQDANDRKLKHDQEIFQKEAELFNENSFDCLLNDLWNAYCFSDEKRIIDRFEDFHKSPSSQFLKKQLQDARREFMKMFESLSLFIRTNFDHNDYTNDLEGRGLRYDLLPNKNPQFTLDYQHEFEYFNKLRELQDFINKSDDAYKVYRKK